MDAVGNPLFRGPRFALFWSIYLRVLLSQHDLQDLTHHQARGPCANCARNKTIKTQPILLSSCTCYIRDALTPTNDNKYPHLNYIR